MNNPLLGIEVLPSIQEAFADYYRTTVLAEETDPNKLHDLKAALDGYARIAKLAIYRYHKGTERARAHAYLLHACQRNGLNNIRRIDAATATLDSYIDWAKKTTPSSPTS